MICAGIDAGSRAIKIALVDAESGQLAASGRTDQGVRQEELAMELLDGLLGRCGLSREDPARVVATGYARHTVSRADTTVTEITCHGRGVHHHVPAARTIVEIGGQDSKLICLDGGGRVRDFAMNDRCAAGTGRFLEVVAERLQTRLDHLGEMAAKARHPAAISSMCVVFAETEIIGLLASGTSPADIVAGVQASIATRIAAMAGRNLRTPIIFTGGVALVPGMDAALESALGSPVSIAPDPQITGALGAAVLAARRLNGWAPASRQG